MKWLTVKEVSELLDVTVSAIQKSLKKNKYIHRYVPGVGGNSGRVLEILLESLPDEAQDRYHDKRREHNNRVYMSLTAEQRATVDYKLTTVMKYKEFKETYREADKMVAFLKQYNESHPEEPITKRQLNYWENKYNEDNIEGLVDKRGGHNKGQSVLPDEAWQVFLKLWSKTSKPSIQSCYEMTKAFLPNIKIPSLTTFKRKLEKVDMPYRTLYREGKKAFEDKCLPYISMDYSDIKSNQQWVSDHHLFDVLVVDERGKVFRPWLSGWIDRKARYIVGYSVNKVCPNSDIVLDSFARACHQCGIPDEVLLDNGKDYKVYDLFNNKFPLSVTQQMGIHVKNALPYNAKAKPIERLFGTLEGKYCKHLVSYIGNDPKKRPEHMQKVNAKLKDKCITYKEFLEFIDNMVKSYNNTPHEGEGMEGRTPQDVYAENLVSLKTVKGEDILNMFLMRTSKPLTVSRKGIRVPEIGFYFDDDMLYPLQGQKVFVRYNSDNVKLVYVFTLEDEFICIAKCEQLSSLDADITMERIRENNRRKKERRKLTKMQFPKVLAPTIEEYVASQNENTNFVNQGNKNNVTLLAPAKYKHAKAIKRERARHEYKDNPVKLEVVNGISTKEADRALYEFYRRAGK